MNRFPLAHTHICATLWQGSVRLLSDLLSVHLGRAAVILGVGVICGAAMLAEECHLQKEGERKVMHHITVICTNNVHYISWCWRGITEQERSNSCSTLGRHSDLPHWHFLQPAYIWAETSSSWSPTLWTYGEGGERVQSGTTDIQTLRQNDPPMPQDGKPDTVWRWRWWWVGIQRRSTGINKMPSKVRR